MVTVWKLEKDAKEDYLTMLNVNESVNFACVAKRAEEEEAEEDADALIGTVSSTGVFRAFEFDPRSKRRKSKMINRPKLTVKVASGKDSNGKVMPIPVLGCNITKKSEIQLVHGSHNNPVLKR